MVTPTIRTALIIGGSHGLGLSFAERLLSLGKKVIVTGRPGSKNLTTLTSTHPILLTASLDLSSLPSLPTEFTSLLQIHPDINSIWINAGVANWCSLTDIDSTSDANIINTVNVNTIAPMILIRHAISFLKGKPDPSIFVTGAGLGFVPNPIAPVYCASKAAVHSFVVSARQAVKKSPVEEEEERIKIVEIVPPMVVGVGLAEGTPNTNTKGALELGEYLDVTFKALGAEQEVREVAAGSAIERVKAWREGPGQLMMEMGLGD